MDMNLSLARRLSIFIREEQPQKLLQISQEIINKLMIRLDIQKQRDLSDINAVWVLATMYCIITRDLFLFRRMFRDAAHIKAMFEHAINYNQLLEQDKIINPILAKQYKEFFASHKDYLTINNALVAQTIVEDWLLPQQFLLAVDGVAKNYIDTF